jgi:hypothetical protein
MQFSCENCLDTKLFMRTINLVLKASTSLAASVVLEVACRPLVPKFAGSNPAEAVGFFRAPSFGGEVKPSVPCRRFTACKRSLNASWKSGISGKIHRQFLAHIVPHLATGISGETSGESWNV